MCCNSKIFFTNLTLFKGIGYLFLVSPLFSQNTINTVDFFPHQKGDTWVYLVRNGVGDDTLKVTIVSDSTDTEGNTYIRYLRSMRQVNDLSELYWPENYKIDSLGNIYLLGWWIDSRLQFKIDAQLEERWWTGADSAYIYMKC